MVKLTVCGEIKLEQLLDLSVQIPIFQPLKLIDLIKNFYPDGKAQLTQVPIIDIKEGKVAVKCSTPGARIGYRYASEKAPHKGWEIYKEPITEKPNDTLEIITHRLGYKFGITSVVNGIKGETTYPPNRHDLKRE